MASEWTTIQLGEVATVRSGYAFKSADWKDQGIPVVKIANVKGGYLEMSGCSFVSESTAAESGEFQLSHGDILIAMTGYIGDVARVRKTDLPCVLNQRVGKFTVRDKERLDPDFLYTFLAWAETRQTIEALGYGSAQPNVSPSLIHKVELPLPPLAEQKAIAAVLGALDDKIELNRRMNATLEAMARALFQSWFVDFDPVRAKQEGRKPTGMDDATAALFPDSFSESELGEIPVGWSATTLRGCIGFSSGFAFKSQDWKEYGVPVVKIGSVKPGIIDLTQVSYVSCEIAQQAARYRLSTGDLLIGMTGYVGEVGLVPPSDNPPLLNQRVGKFVMAKPGTESLAFWYCTTRQPVFKAFVEARSHGTAQANVSGESIMQFPMIAPPSGILDAFNRNLQPVLDRILRNHCQSCTLATLRDALLPKLLSGELRVPDAERAVSAVA